MDVFTGVLIFCGGFCAGVSFLTLCLGYMNREVSEMVEPSDEWKQG